MADNEWHRVMVDLRNKHQLHMRPAQRIVDVSSKYRSTEVRAVKDDADYDAKSILDIIEFTNYFVNEVVAVRDDYTFTFKARGPDAEAVLKDLSDLVDRRFDMDED